MLSNTILTGARGTRDRGLMIYQSMSGDATGSQGSFTMMGGTYTWPSTSGPAFFVTNATGEITLNGVTLQNSSETLLKAGADQWGTSGANGGTAIFTTSGQALTGSLVADSISSIIATLQNGSSLTGAINAAHTAKAVQVNLDASSNWTVTDDSYLTCLNDANGIGADSVTNITGNGYTVYYDASSCTALGGQTYMLGGGGYLKPTN